jgi:hypothetical protein
MPPDENRIGQLYIVGSILASSDTVESEGRQMMQCWKMLEERGNTLLWLPLRTGQMGPLDENRVAQLYAFPYSLG